VALDHDVRLLDEASRTSRRDIGFIAAEATHLPFAPKSFDYIAALGVFAYIREPLQILLEFRRVCRAGGTIFLTNAVRHSRESLLSAAEEAQLEVSDVMEGFCPAATGDIKRRYMLVLACR
jgi:ubiquinone/menaquinone biosynthesis C-methylase UbiE